MKFSISIARAPRRIFSDLRSVNLAAVCGCILLLALPLTAQAAEPLGDFDGDGYSDFSNVQINRKPGATSWSVQLTSGGTLSYFFPAAADVLVAGRFFPEKKTYPGVVIAQPGSALQWYVKTAGPVDAAFQFGLPGDHIPNQADFDCDGISDIAVVRDNGHPAFPGFKTWYIALSASGTVQQIVFGNIHDGAAAADLDGDRCSELLILRDGFHWFARKLFSGEVKVTQWGVPGDIPLLPIDLDEDGAADFAVARHTPGGQIVIIKYSSGTFHVEHVGTNESVAVLGKFATESYSAAIDRRTGQSQLHFQSNWSHSFTFGTPSGTIVRPDGSVVLPLESGAFFKSASAGTASFPVGLSDMIGDGCSLPRFPDGINKKRGWAITTLDDVATYLIQDAAREIEVFGADGRKIDEMFLVLPGGKKRRESWSTSMQLSDLLAFAPLTIKETSLKGECSIVEIPNPNANWD